MQGKGPHTITGLNALLSPEALNVLLTNVVADILSVYGNEIQQIILFGSYAKGKAKPKSDIDVLVLFKSRLPIIPDHMFAGDMNIKYLNLTNKTVHIVFEKYYYYTCKAEKCYADVPNYGRVIYQS